MTTIRWTDQAIADLVAIRAFIQQDSPHYASVIVARLIRAVDRHGKLLFSLVNSAASNIMLVENFR